MQKHSEDKPIRILVVDDHPIVRAGLATLIGREPDFHLEAGVESGAEALRFLKANPVDIVLLDLRMPGRTGLEVMPEILCLDDPAQVIILSSFDFEEEVYRAARIGARGYLMKDATRAEIIECIRTVMVGGLYFPKEIAARLAERESRPGLSPRELDVLGMIARGLTNKEVARVLAISQFTARNHVNHILDKLHASDRTEAVSIAMQQGILTMMP